MTSKERVTKTLRHETPDRVPRNIWLGGEVIKRLTERFGVSKLELEFKMGSDILQSWVSVNGEMERDVPHGTEFTDGFGITWKRDGAYNSVINHPLRGMDAAQIAAHPFPEPHTPERYEYLDFLIKEYGGEYYIGADVSGLLFEPACYLRNMEDVMVDMATDSEEAEVLLDRLADFSAAVSLESVRRGADWIWTGDDLGSQQGMMMNPEMWRRHIKPRMKRIIDEIRSLKPGMPIAYHSCGAMSQVIGDLVEIGVDVLNPIQESATGMDQKEIKDRYGDRLTLMCGIDTQQFMTNRSPEEIYKKTREKVRELGAGGGYIFAVSHHIQGDITDEKIFAMLKALDEPY